VARERDLCDVKIKITEYFDQQEYTEQVGQPPPGAEQDDTSPMASNLPDALGVNQHQDFFRQVQMLPQGWDIPPNMSQAGMAMPQFTAGLDSPLTSRPPPRKYYTFQRVSITCSAKVQTLTRYLHFRSMETGATAKGMVSLARTSIHLRKAIVSRRIV
jgi:hypothetical protein